MLVLSGGHPPPPRGWYKINTDASFVSSTGVAVSGVAVRDENGTLLSGCWEKHATHSSLMAEAFAIRDGLPLATSLSLDKVLLESDNLEVIQACRKENQRGEIRTVLEDIWRLKEQLHSCGFTWTERQGNELAHQIAALARVNRLPLNWTYNIPSSVNFILQKDRLGISNERRQGETYLSILQANGAGMEDG